MYAEKKKLWEAVADKGKFLIHSLLSPVEKKWSTFHPLEGEINLLLEPAHSFCMPADGRQSKQAESVRCFHCINSYLTEKESRGGGNHWENECCQEGRRWPRAVLSHWNSCCTQETFLSWRVTCRASCNQFPYRSRGGGWGGGAEYGTPAPSGIWQEAPELPPGREWGYKER